MEDKATLVYDKVKELAKEKGVTIQQMEKDLSIAEGHACKWNTSQPKLKTLMKIADYFGVTLDYFKDSDEKGGQI